MVLLLAVADASAPLFSRCDHGFNLRIGDGDAGELPLSLLLLPGFALRSRWGPMGELGPALSSPSLRCLTSGDPRSFRCCGSGEDRFGVFGAALLSALLLGPSPDLDLSICLMRSNTDDALPGALPTFGPGELPTFGGLVLAPGGGGGGGGGPELLLRWLCAGLGGERRAGGGPFLPAAAGLFAFFISPNFLSIDIPGLGWLAGAGPCPLSRSSAGWPVRFWRSANFLCSSVGSAISGWDADEKAGGRALDKIGQAGEHHTRPVGRHRREDNTAERDHRRLLAER